MSVEVMRGVGPAQTDVACERFGDPDAPPVLLVMGLATQMLGWPGDFCSALVARGVQVIRLDNRDVGLSTHLTDAPRADVIAAMSGDSSSASYTLSDMAADTVGLLDALAIESAHVVGASMGGMIAQTIAIEYPGRVRSLTSIMSTTGDPTVGQATQEALGVLLSPPAASRQEAADRTVAIFGVIGSPGFELDEVELRERAQLAYDRGDDPPGVARQLLAIIASGDRTASLRSVRIPTLVLHGSAGVLRDVRVAIIGAGFGGLGVAIKLRDAGIDDFLVLERDQALGGTWWANTYPGCACDVPAHLYSYSFQLNPNWSRMFAPQPEILEYLRRTARERGIEGHLRFRTHVQGARWDGDEQRWHVDTSRGSLRAEVLVAAAGGLVEPKYPDIPGLTSFQGACFHSARWDHEHDLRGERVGVIGTGASAAQFIPEIQKHVGTLTVFQRTPGWVLPRLDHPHSDTQKRMFTRFPVLQRAVRSSLYYSAEALVLGLVYDQRLLKAPERVARRHLRKQVPDPGLRARLTPNFRIGCKRIIFSNDYLRSYTEPNVELVSDGIREVVADGVITNAGRHVELDTIVLGTGFHVFDPPHAARVFGRDGRTLKARWSDGGIRAYLGTAIPNFPNHFMVMGPNTGLGNNSMINVIEAHAGYVVAALESMDAHGLSSIEVREDVEERFNEDIQGRLQHTVWNEGGCKSWYVGPDGRNHTLWPSFSDAFKHRLARFDEADFVTHARTREPVGV